MTPGYQALRVGAALLDLDSRGRFHVLGEDRARLLHAMSTNHIQQLKPGLGCYVFFLNAQGRILSDATIFCLAGSFLLDTEPASHATLFQHLDKFIIADDVTLEDARQSLTALAVEGPASADLLRRVGAPVPSELYSVAEWTPHLVARVSTTGAEGYRIYISRAQRDELISALTNAGAVPASPEDVETVRLEHHKPRYGDDISDRYLVQETRQMQAVHFSKGCYLGQEIVERVRSRGQVHRLLTPLAIDAPQPPEKGVHLKSGDLDAGEITSAALSPANGKVMALAYLRSEHARPGAHLTVDGAPAEVLALG